MVYHEIFVEPDGQWLARVYENNRVVSELEGEAKGYEQGRAAAVRAVRKLKEKAGYAKRPWWRVW